MPRDDFPASVKRDLAARAGHKCSNPHCGAPTSGPASSGGAINLGVAAHITAAAAGGPRFDQVLCTEERSAPSNGIWLCQSCAALVDRDHKRYTVALLHAWKSRAESRASSDLGYRSISSTGVYLVQNLRFPRENWWVNTRDEPPRLQVAGSFFMTNLTDQPVQIARVILDFQDYIAAWVDLAVRSPSSDVYGDFAVLPNHITELHLIAFLSPAPRESGLLVGGMTVVDQLNRTHKIQSMEFDQLTPLTEND